MIGRRDSVTWFAALRRDGRLFAAVAAILLFAGTLQPLAEARAAETGKAWVICTIFGAAKPADASGDPLDAAGADDCPQCIAGHHCGAPTPPAGTGAASPEPVRPDRVAIAAFHADAWSLIPPYRGPPGGIRAPPLPA